MTSGEQPSETGQTWRQGIGYTIIAIGLAGTAFTAKHFEDITIHNNSVAASDDKSASCQAASPENIHAVTELFDNPPKYPQTGDNRFTRGRQHSAFMTAQAQKLGISFPAYHHDLTTDYYVDPYRQEGNYDFADYLRLARGVLDQVGIKISVGPPPDYDDAAKTPTKNELETNEAKFQVYQLAELIAYLPEQLTSNIGVSEVALTAHSEDSGIVLSGDTIAIDVTNPEKEDTSARHELFHVIHQKKICGKASIFADKAFADLNVRSRYAGTYPLPEHFLDNQPVPYDDTYEITNNLWDQMKDARMRGDNTAYCAAQAKTKAVLAPVEKFGDDYSYSNVAEEEANLGGEILQPGAIGFSTLLSRESPVIRKKTLFELARLYDVYPNVVRYWAIEADLGPEKSDFDCSSKDTVRIAAR